MAENRVWLDKMKVRKGSLLEPILRTGCLVVFTKSFNKLTERIHDLDALNEAINPYGPFTTRDESFPTFYEALNHAAHGPDGSIIPIRGKQARGIASVDLT